MYSNHGRTLGLPATVFWTLACLLGLAAFIPAIVAWFSAEELTLLYAVRDDPFAIWSGRDRQPGFFRPVVPLIIWLWQKLWGLEPRPYHLLNVTLHLANSWLVYVIARRWTDCLPELHRLRHGGVAALAALWFWVWPAHSEAVAWIPAITDVAAATGALASLAAYLCYRRTGRWGWAAASLAFYAIALCTKESAITLPAAVFLYEVSRAVETGFWNWRNAVLPMALVGIMAGYFVLRRLLMGVFLGGYGSDIHKNFSWERLQWALSPNLANAFFPLPWLTVFQRNWVMSAFALACVVGIAWRWRKGGGSALPVAAMALCAVVVFLPGLNLGPGMVTEGQRFAYLASAFGVISVAMVVAYVLPQGRTLTVTAWVVALASAALLATYNNNWYVAGKVARKIVRGMKKLPDARRTYVLTTTDSYREAFIMPHNLQSIYHLFVKEPRAGELVMASAVANWESGVNVQVNPEVGVKGQPVYVLSLAASEYGTGGKAQLQGFTDPYAAQWYEVEEHGPVVRVALKDYNPDTDKVFYLSGGDWVQVAGRH